MKTRCPYCNTVYDIDEATLASTDYTAVCCQCHRVFSTAKPSEPEEPVVTSPVIDEQENPLAHMDEIANTEAEDNAIISAEPEEDEWNFVQHNKAQENNRPAPSLATDIPEDFTSLAAAELPENHSSGPQRAKNKSSSLLITGVLLFTLLGLAQFAWINKQKLLDHPQGRQLVQQFCELVECELEQKIAIDKFAVLHRDLQPAISHRHALSFTLSFTNNADFSQQLPRLQLSLLDHNDEMLSQRSFTPDEYLYPATGSGRTMKPKEIINVELLLQDPDLNASGFKLEFL